ncbi:MAG: hypothetical protein JSW00_17705 [Thermoplasmata archaeon]|nr:MAG: hypothetical protein JSW00_17705 [Thermoplasmata archaeon]
MRDIEFLELVRDSKLPVFTPLDISRLIKKSSGYVYTYLNRLTKRKLIARIEHGKYSLPDTPIESVATNLIYPSYISFLTAFYYHKKTTQIPREISVVTVRSKKAIEYRDYKIKFVKFKPENVMGYEKMKNGYTWYLGTLEKSIIDSLYLPANCSVADSMIAIGDGVNTDKMINYCISMSSKVTMKRVGFLLELYGIDVSDSLVRHLNNKYDPLDPLLPVKGEKNRKWHLIVNMEVNYAL